MSAHRFRFRTRWLGYDRAEVNRFLDQVAADRQFLKDKVNYLESFVAKQDGGSASGVRAVPGSNEPSARAALDAQRLQCLRDLNRELAGCLTASAAVLRKIHEQLPAEPSGPPAQPPPDPSTAEPAILSAPEPTPATPLIRRLAYAGLVVLAVGGAGVTAVTHVPASAPQRGGDQARAMHTSLPVVPQPIAPPFKPEKVIQSEAAVPAAKVPEAAGALAPTADPSTADKGLYVMLAATGNCWIRSVVDGSHPVERTMLAGETILVWGRDEVILRAGDGGALTAAINGQAAVPLGRAGQVVTRRITRANPRLVVQDPA